MSSKTYVTASEIGEYVYCKRAWWLRFMGYQVGDIAAMRRGAKAHANLFTNLLAYSRHRFIGVVLIAILALIIIFLAYLSFVL